MKPIDLSKFADHSQKIPQEFLTTKLHSEIPFKKSEILATHILDSVVIVQVFVWFRSLLEVSVGDLMMTNLLSDAFASTGGLFLNSILLSLIGFTYFSTSYFFNQGQTAGMKLMKRRITMEELSFESAFKWSCYSLGLYLSFGFSIAKLHKKLQDDGHGSFSSQDHYYQQLMAYKNWAVPSLIESTHNHSQEIEIYAEVA